MIKKIKIDSPNPWLAILLKQYMPKIEFGEDGDFSILEQENNIDISLKNSKQTWCLTKPISLPVLFNILKQGDSILANNVIMIGPISFYPNQRICFYKENEIDLTQKESEILLYLHNHQQYVNKATLLKAIWDYAPETSTYTLETHIYKLRNKFIDKYDLIISNEKGYTLNLS